MSSVRRTALALVAGLVLAVLTPALAAVTGLGATPAFACTCANDSMDKQADAADAVFTGRITRISRSSTPQQGPGARSAGFITYGVTVGESLKGQVGRNATVRTADSAVTCGLTGAKSGDTYVFFATARGKGVRRVWAVNSCGGSQRMTAQVSTELDGVFGTGQEVDRQAKLTPVSPDEPTGFARLAAPGAALALVGALGWVAVRRFGR